MTDPTMDPDTTSRLRMEAAGWRIRLTESGESRNPDFEAWLAQSGAHRDAWESMSATWALMGEIGNSPDLADMREAARAERDGLRRISPFQTRTGRAGLGLIAASLIAIAVLAGQLWPQGDYYATARGEKLKVSLVDGSHLMLDADTQIRVSLSKSERSLQLLKGQASFDVAHDPRRPFVVAAADKEIIAIGTAFDVNLSGETLSVTLIEGEVLIKDGNCCVQTQKKISPSFRLNIGEQLVVDSSKVPAIQKVKLKEATSWQRDEIIFDNEPLTEIIRRIAPYTPITISVADSKVGDLRLSGVFRTDNVQGFIQTVTEYLDLSFVQDGRHIKIFKAS